MPKYPSHRLNATLLRKISQNFSRTLFLWVHVTFTDKVGLFYFLITSIDTCPFNYVQGRL